MLTPVENPTAYGLVETDADSNILRFLEKPKPEEITCNTINAGIYVLEPETFDRIPENVAWSIERSFFPSFIERGETFLGVDLSRLLDRHRHAGKVHAGAPGHHGRPLLVPPFNGKPGVAWVAPTRARRRRARGSKDRSSSMTGASCEAGARIGPYSVLGRNCQIDEDAKVAGAIVWAETTHRPRGARSQRDRRPQQASIGRNASIQRGVLGDQTSIAEYSRL